jgi:hypothetical protein
MRRLALLALLLVPISAQAKPKWNRLSSPSASASSYLQNNWNKFTENYHPSYAFDGDPKTAWVEGVEGEGAGEWIEWPISTLERARAIKVRIRSGYFKSKPLFEANAAPKEVRVEVRDTSGAVVAKAKADLSRKMEWQEVVVDTSKAGELGALRLAIVSAHPGTQYQDTCISDVETYADSDVKYKAAVEKGKQKALLSWIAERKKQAAYFAKLPKTYPFASTHFDTESKSDFEEGAATPLPQQLSTGKLSGVAGKTIDSEFKRWIGEIDQREKDGGQAVGALVRPAVARSIPLPDGMEEMTAYSRTLPFFAKLLDPENVSFFEAAKEASIDLTKTEQHERELTRKWSLDGIRVAWSATDKKIPARIYLKETFVYEERSVYEATIHHLVICDPRGRPSELVSKEVGDGTLSYTWIRFGADASGRIQRVELKRAAFYQEIEEEPGSNSFSTAVAKVHVELAKAK